MNSMRLMILGMLVMTTMACTMRLNFVPSVPPGTGAVANVGHVNAAQRAAVVGTWREYWQDREGCHDVMKIDIVGRQLALSGADCNTGEAYTISQAGYDGEALVFTLTTPSTGFSHQYTLNPRPDGSLQGDAVGQGKLNPISWQRL